MAGSRRYVSRRPRNPDAPLRGWALPRGEDGDPIEELHAILKPLGGEMDRAELEESAGNVLRVESILQRWKDRQEGERARDAVAAPEGHRPPAPHVRRRAPQE